MKRLLVHGCYDHQTLKTLLDLGVSEFGFDLRGRSPNLIPFSQLKILLGSLVTERVFLTFGDDRETTILSFLNMLKNEAQKFILEFRDTQAPEFYESLNVPYVWMFDPEGNWEKILGTKNIVGVVLPLKHQLLYQTLPRLWQLVEQNNLKIYLHANSFEEATFLSNKKDIDISVDLTSEVENGFRSVDQDKLRTLRFWKQINENSSL